MIWYYEKNLDNTIHISTSYIFEIKDLTRLINMVHANKSSYDHLLGFCVSVNPLIIISL